MLIQMHDNAIFEDIFPNIASELHIKIISAVQDLTKEPTPSNITSNNNISPLEDINTKSQTNQKKDLLAPLSLDKK
jgi:hypothetical protein